MSRRTQRRPAGTVRRRVYARPTELSHTSHGITGVLLANETWLVGLNRRPEYHYDVLFCLSHKRRLLHIQVQSLLTLVVEGFRTRQSYRQR